MKKLATIIALGASAMYMSSCGVISNSHYKGRNPVFMIDAPGDLTVTANGKPCEMSSEVFAASSNIGGTVTTAFYTKAALVPKGKKQTLELYSPSMNKRATVKVKPKVNGKIVFLDIIFGGIGLPIDIATGNITQQKKRLVDVKNTFDGRPCRSQGKLKRMTKRKIKHEA